MQLSTSTKATAAFVAVVWLSRMLTPANARTEPTGSRTCVYWTKALRPQSQVVEHAVDQFDCVCFDAARFSGDETRSAMHSMERVEARNRSLNGSPLCLASARGQEDRRH